MGYYIQCKGHFDKAEKIAQEHNGLILSGVKQAEDAFNAGLGVICVVRNPMFEAAGFCFSRDEFEMWADRQGRDHRPKTWVAIDLELAKKLSGYEK